MYKANYLICMKEVDLYYSVDSLEPLRMFKGKMLNERTTVFAEITKQIKICFIILWVTISNSLKTSFKINSYLKI